MTNLSYEISKYLQELL